jgi:hypothetical protein
MVAALVACGDPSKPLQPDPSATHRAAAPALRALPSASALLATSSSAERAEDPACRLKKREHHGEWRPTASEVRAAIKKTDFCAPADWLADELTKCMARLAELEVSVRYGVMDGDNWTPNACDISVSSVDWNGRKWVTFNSDIREGHTFFECVSAMELTAKGFILSTNGCQRLPDGDVTGTFPVLKPNGWSTFPDKLKARLCF